MIGNRPGFIYDSRMFEPVQKTRSPLAWIWFAPAVFWAAGIFYLSTRTGSQLPKFYFPMLDKIVHFVLFGVLALFVFMALRLGLGVKPGLAAMAAFVFASFYGGTDEIHQLFTPGRSCDINDWIADTAGACMIFATRHVRPRETRAI